MLLKNSASVATLAGSSCCPVGTRGPNVSSLPTHTFDLGRKVPVPSAENYSALREDVLTIGWKIGV